MFQAGLIFIQFQKSVWMIWTGQRVGGLTVYCVDEFAHIILQDVVSTIQNPTVDDIEQSDSRRVDCHIAG